MADCHKAGVSGWGIGSMQKWQARMRQGCVVGGEGAWRNGRLSKGRGEWFGEREHREMAGSHEAGVSGWGRGSMDK